MENDESSSQDGQQEVAETTPEQEKSSNLTYNPPQTPKKSGKKKLIIIVLLALLIGGAVAIWFYYSKSENENINESAQNQQEQPAATEVADEEVEQTETVYNSELYPDLSFTVPEGWTVNEPEEYDEPGTGVANSTITITKNGMILRLEFFTVLATGFEGNTCYNFEDLVVVGEYFRYTDETGTVTYTNGTSEKDEEWETIVNDPDFTFLEDPNPNLCINYPYIGEYSSTLNQADYDQPYGFTNNEKVIVFMSAEVSGEVSEELLLEADSIITSKSESVEIL